MIHRPPIGIAGRLAAPSEGFVPTVDGQAVEREASWDHTQNPPVGSGGCSGAVAGFADESDLLAVGCAVRDWRGARHSGECRSGGLVAGDRSLRKRFSDAP